MFWNLFKKKKDIPVWKCLKCEHFCWWDGDYCCLDRNKILIGSPSGRITREQYDSLTRKYKHCWFFDKPKYPNSIRVKNDGLYISIDKLIKK